jgi:hypothetical protein
MAGASGGEGAPGGEAASGDPRVAVELRRLKGASEQRLREYDRSSAVRRLHWYRDRFAGRPLPGQGPLEQAYRLLLARLGIGEAEAPTVERGPERLVFRSRNFCPTLEACRLLGLDTRKVCRLYNEGATQELIRQIDPRLAFRRNYEKLRPYAEYCEEIIELRPTP